MRPIDVLRFAWGSLSRYRLRTTLMLLAMGIGVAAIVLLTSLGEAARRHMKSPKMRYMENGTLRHKKRDATLTSTARGVPAPPTCCKMVRRLDTVWSS